MPQPIVCNIGKINVIIEELKKIEADVSKIRDFLNEYQEDVKILLEKVSSVINTIYGVREEILNLSVLIADKKKEKD